MPIPGYQPRRRGRKPGPAIEAPIRPRCLCGKAIYASQAEAGRARHVLQRKRLDGDRPLVIYLCDVSPGRWHVGHKRGA